MEIQRQIIIWLEGELEGVSGIYPYRQAEEVAAVFGVPLSVAIDGVLAYIREYAGCEFSE